MKKIASLLSKLLLICALCAIRPLNGMEKKSLEKNPETQIMSNLKEYIKRGKVEDVKNILENEKNNSIREEIKNHDNTNKTPLLIEVIKANIGTISQNSLIKLLLGLDSKGIEQITPSFITSGKTDQEGNTSMHCAAKRGLQNVLAILSNMDYDNEFFIKNKLGLKPSDLAKNAEIQGYILRAMQFRDMLDAIKLKRLPTYLLLDLSNNEKVRLENFKGQWLVKRIEKINDYIQNLKNKKIEDAKNIYENLGTITQGERKAINDALEKSEEAKNIDILIQNKNATMKDPELIELSEDIDVKKLEKLFREEKSIELEKEPSELKYPELNELKLEDLKVIEDEKEPSESEAKDVDILMQLKNAINKNNFPIIRNLTVEKKTVGGVLHNVFWRRNKQTILEYAIEHLNNTIKTGDANEVSFILVNSPYNFADLFTYVPIEKHPFRVVLDSNKLSNDKKISMLKVLVPYFPHFPLNTIINNEVKTVLLHEIVKLGDLDMVKWIMEHGGLKTVEAFDSQFRSPKQYALMSYAKDKKVIAKYLEKMEALNEYITNIEKLGRAQADSIFFKKRPLDLDQEEALVFYNERKNILLDAIEQNETKTINNMYSINLWNMYKESFEQAVIKKLYDSIDKGNLLRLDNIIKNNPYNVSDFINNPIYNKIPILNYVLQTNLGADLKNKMIITLITKANPNASDPAGNTPLHLAAMQGDQGVVKALLDNGAMISVTKQNNSGKKPSDLTKNDNIVKLLKQADDEETLKDLEEIIVEEKPIGLEKEPSELKYPELNELKLEDFKVKDLEEIIVEEKPIELEKEPSELKTLKENINKNFFVAIWENIVDQKTGVFNNFWDKNKQAISKYAVKHLNDMIERGCVELVHKILMWSPYRFAELVKNVPMEDHPFNVVLNSELDKNAKIAMLKELVPYFPLDTILTKTNEVLLHKIINLKDLNFVIWIIENGGLTTINNESSYGKKPIDYAKKQKAMEISFCLKEAGSISIEKKSEMPNLAQNKSEINYNIGNKYFSFIKILKANAMQEKNNAIKNATGVNDIPMQILVENIKEGKFKEAEKILLDNEDNLKSMIKAHDARKITPLLIKIFDANKQLPNDLLKILLEKGFVKPGSVDSQGNTPTHLATMNNQSDILSVLSDYPAYINEELKIRNKENFLPIELAKDQKAKEIIEKQKTEIKKPEIKKPEIKKPEIKKPIMSAIPSFTVKDPSFLKSFGPHK